jgi:hypothetical protein
MFDVNTLKAKASAFAAKAKTYVPTKRELKFGAAVAGAVAAIAVVQCVVTAIANDAGHEILDLI